MQPESTGPGVPEHRRKIKVPGHPGIFKKGERFLVPFRHRGRQRARYFRTLSEAVRFKRQVDAGDTQPTSREPFNRYAARWIESYTGRTSGGVSSVTRTSYADAIARVAVPYFRTTRMDEIDAPMLREFIASLAAKHFAPSTVRRYYAPVRALLATAYEDGLIRTNPAANVRVIVPKMPERKKRLTPDETRALLAQMPPEHADLAYLLAATGLRIGEALAARWMDLGQNVDGRPVLTVPKSKTPSGQRVIPLSPETVRRLIHRRANATFGGDADPIFPNGLGQPIDGHNYRQRIFNVAAKKAGVEWATPHTLRHAFAISWDAHGYTPSQIASQLGHADGGVLALRTYVHAGTRSMPPPSSMLRSDTVRDGSTPGVNGASERCRTSSTTNAMLPRSPEHRRTPSNLSIRTRNEGVPGSSPGVGLGEACTVLLRCGAVLLPQEAGVAVADGHQLLEEGGGIARFELVSDRAVVVGVERAVGTEGEVEG